MLTLRQHSALLACHEAANLETYIFDANILDTGLLRVLGGFGCIAVCPCCATAYITPLGRTIALTPHPFPKRS